MDLNDLRAKTGFCMYKVHKEGIKLYLFLSQNEDPSRFNRVPGGKIDPRSPLHSVLVGLPLAISC